MWWYWTLGLYPQGIWQWPGDRYQDQFDGAFYGVASKHTYWWMETHKQVRMMYAYGLAPHGVHHSQVIKNYRNSGMIAYLSHKNPEWDDNPMDPYGIDPFRWWYSGPRVTMKLVNSSKYIPQLPLRVYGELVVKYAKSYNQNTYNHYNWYGRKKHQPRQRWSPIITLYQSRFHKTNWPYWSVVHAYLWSPWRHYTHGAYRDITNGTWPWRWWWNSLRRNYINMNTEMKWHANNGKMVYKFRAYYGQWAWWHPYNFFWYQDNWGHPMFGWALWHVNSDALIHHMGTAEDGYDNKYNKFSVEFRSLTAHFGPNVSWNPVCSHWKWAGGMNKEQDSSGCFRHPYLVSGWHQRDKRVICRHIAGNKNKAGQQHLVGNSAGYQEQWNGRKWAHYWRNLNDCIDQNHLYDYRKKICREPVTNCRALNVKRNNCATCNNGYQMHAKVTLGKGKKAKSFYKSREWFWKRGAKFRKIWVVKHGELWRKNSLRCLACPTSRVYNPRTRECHKSRVDPNLIYDISKLHTGMITLTDLKVPSYASKPPFEQDNVAVFFDIAVYNITKVTDQVIAETYTWWSPDGACKNLKCGEKYRRYYPLRIREAWKRPDSQRVWANLDYGDFKDDEGKPYLRLMFQHLVPPGKFLKIRLSLFTKSNNYKNFYIKRFNHRFDSKHDKDNFYAKKGKAGASETEDGSTFVDQKTEKDELGQSFQVSKPLWHWHHKQIYAKKRDLPVDRAIGNPAFGEKKGDSPGFLTYVKAGKPIPKDYQLLRMSLDRKMTVAQTWIKIGGIHMKRQSKVVDLMAINLKNIHGGADLNLSLHALPMRNELFAMTNGKRVPASKRYIKKGPFSPGASITGIDWKKWQFVGVAIKYRVYRNKFVQCLHLVSSRINGNVYKGGSGF
jgi:hypothetical protein